MQITTYRAAQLAAMKPSYFGALLKTDKGPWPSMSTLNKMAAPFGLSFRVELKNIETDTKDEMQ